MPTNSHKEKTESLDASKAHLKALARLLAKQVARDLPTDEKSDSDDHGKNIDQIVSEISDDGVSR